MNLQNLQTVELYSKQAQGQVEEFRSSVYVSGNGTIIGNSYTLQWELINSLGTLVVLESSVIICPI